MTDNPSILPRACVTRTGEAVHARPANVATTYCGRVPHLAAPEVEITDDGIQHPWRCTRCSRSAANEVRAQSKPEHRFTIKNTRNGDEAFADDIGGALTAADTLAHDCSNDTGRPLTKSREDTLILHTADGALAAALTQKAWRGERA